MGKFVPCVINEEGYLLTRELQDLKEIYKNYCEALENYKKYYLGKKCTETDKSKIIDDILAKIHSKKKEILETTGKNGKKFWELILSESHIDTIKNEIFLIEESINRYDENLRRSFDEKYRGGESTVLEIAKLLNNSFGSISSNMLDGFKEETKESLDFYNMLDGEHRRTLNLALAREFYDLAEKAYMIQVEEKQQNCEHKFTVPVSKTIVEFEPVDPTNPMDQRGKYLTKNIQTCMCEKCGLIDTKIINYQDTPIFYPTHNSDKILSHSEGLARTRKK